MERALRKALPLCLVASLVLVAGVVIAVAPFPYELNHTEPLLVDQAQRILARQSIYKPVLDEPPYVIANWPPLYPLLLAGVGAMAPLPLLQVGRVVSLLAALVSGLVVALFAIRLSGCRLSGLLAAALFLAHPFALTWMPLARVDLTALALSLVAFWLLYTRWQSWPWLIVSMACLVASIYTRQSFALAVPVAGAIWLWHNDRHRALFFIAGSAFTCLLLFWLLNYATGGGFFLHVIAANLGTYLPGRMQHWGIALLALWPIALALAGLTIARTLNAFRRERNVQDGSPQAQPFLLYGLLPYTACACLSALTAGKLGSDVNYFLEPIAALSIWAALAVAWLPERKPVLRQVILALVLCQVIWVFAADTMLQAARVSRWTDLRRYDEIRRQVAAASEKGPVLAGDHLYMLILAGQPIYFDPFGYEQVRRAGLWDPSNLVREIKAHKFPLILIEDPGGEVHQQGWPPEFTAAIEESYEGTEQFPGLVLYRPHLER